MKYDRQIILDKVGKKGQEAIKKTSIAIVGVGGLGSVAADLLARAGMGTLVLIDGDKVDVTNLHRQSLFTEKDVGLPKVEAAKQHLQKINPDTKIITHTEFLTEKNTDILKADIIIDGLDTFPPRELIDQYAHANNIPWIHGAAIKTIGRVFVFKEKRLKDLYPYLQTTGNCAEQGILSPVNHIVASLQVMQAFKLILKETPESNLFVVDGWKGTIEKIKVN